MFMLGVSLLPLAANALAPTKEMETITRMTALYMTKRHFMQKPLDDKLSETIFNEYFKTLDPGRTFFTAQDIEKFKDYRTKLDDKLKTGDVTFAFDVFNVLLERLDEYEKFADAAIAQGVDLTKNEELEINREKSPWAESKDELKDLWRKKLKNDIIILSLMDRSQKLDTAKKSAQPNGVKPHESWTPKAPQERVRKRITQLTHYYKDLEPIEVLELYLSSIMKIYDPHSEYMSPRSEQDFDIGMKLSLVGIGALLSSEDGYTKVVKIIPGGPAESDGRLQPEDRIIAVSQENGETVDTLDMPLNKVVNLIRGEAGSKVTLSILEGAKGVNAVPKQITLKRDKVMLKESEAKGKIEEVKASGGKKLRIGIITLPSFYIDFNAAFKGDENFKSSTRDVAKIISEFQEKGPLDGLIIDLRSNGGGSLLEAITLTGLFIKSGPVVQVKDLQSVDIKNDEDGGKVAYSGPLTVMTNRLSASAAEIFAAAIKDYNRGVIVGDSKTHGKGTVQTVIGLEPLMPYLGAKFPAGSLKLTNAKFYRINGASTQLKGVTPDVIYPSFTDSMDIGEEKLSYAMPWDTILPAPYQSSGNSLASIIPKLRENSAKRIDESRDFKALMKDINYFNKIKNRKTVSLNLETRWQEYLSEKKIQEEQAKLLRLGEDDSADVQNPKSKKEIRDIYMDETILVTRDLIDLEIKTQSAEREKDAKTAASAKNVR